MDDTSEAVHVLENGNSKHMGEATADIETKTVPPVVRQKSILKNGSTPADSDRLKRAVSWQDFQGKELHQVREFEPSEHGSDDEPSEEKKDGACCVIS